MFSILKSAEEADLCWCSVYQNMNKKIAVWKNITIWQLFDVFYSALWRGDQLLNEVSQNKCKKPDLFTDMVYFADYLR